MDKIFTSKIHYLRVIFLCLLLGNLWIIACSKDSSQKVASTPLATSTLTLPPSSTLAQEFTATKLPSSPSPVSDNPTRLSPSLSPKPPTQTATPTRQPTNTATLRQATLTPRSTSTRFPEEILTPSTPSAGFESYRLVNWTPRRAENLIAALEAFAENQSRVKTDEHIALVEREAALRFPDDIRSKEWLLQAGISSAYGDSIIGGEILQNIIIKSIEKKEIALDSVALESWFDSLKTGLTLTVEKLPPLPGYLNSSILSILGDFSISGDAMGGTTFWVLEQPDGFVSFPLFNQMGDRFTVGYVHALADITGDGIDDIFIHARSHNGTFVGGDFAIYDLSVVPPAKLTLGPEPAWLVSAGWTSSIGIKQSLSGKNQIQLSGQPSDDSCIIEFSNTFEWNGQWLDLVEVGINYDARRFSCVYRLAEFAYLSNLEQKAMLKTYEATFGDIKPTGPGYNPDSDYPADAQDEFRYRLAIQHALLGQSSEAITYLLKIIETPAAPDSRWIEPAQEFLELYQTPQDIYKVCLHAKTECRIHQALEQAVRSFTIADYPVLLQRLEEHGVPILAKAFINIDLDSSLDQWFITRNPIDGQFELWLISSSAYAPKAIFISNVPSLHPEFKLYTLEWWSNRYNLISHENLFSIFSVNTQNLFAFVRRKLDLEPYVVPYEVNEDSKHLASYPLLWQTINDLLSGADPKWVIERLNIIAEEESYYADRELNYFLGLAYELSGDEDNAVKAYLTVWRSCCFHYWDGPVVDPFAIMAQAKLRKIP